MRGSILAMMVAAPLACTDDTARDGVELEPRCGGETAIEVVELGPGEGVYSVSPFDEDRVLVRIGTETEVQRTVVASTCGGAPEPVSPGVSWVFEHDGVLLGCDDDNALVQLRELGDPSPQLLVERGCASARNEFGMVAIESAEGSTTGRLLRLRVQGQAIVREPLLEDLRVPTFPYLYNGLLRDEAGAVGNDGTLRVVNIVSGAVTPIADAVDTWYPVEDRMLVRHGPGAPEGEGAIRLVDRHAGTNEVLTIAGANDRIAFMHDTLFVGLDGPAQTQLQVVDARDGRPIVPPAGFTVGGAPAPGVLWLSRFADDGFVTHFRWREGEAPVEIASCYACGLRAVSAPDGALISGDAPAPTLWFAEADGGAAQQLAGPVGREFALLEDRRVLTVPGSDDVEGPLLVFDPDEPAPLVLAEQVSPWSTYLTDTYRGDPRDVLYESAPLDGAHALQLVRLAER